MRLIELNCYKRYAERLTLAAALPKLVQAGRAGSESGWPVKSVAVLRWAC